MYNWSFYYWLCSLSTYILFRPPAAFFHAVGNNFFFFFSLAYTPACCSASFNSRHNSCCIAPKRNEKKKSFGNICSLLFDLLEWGNSAAAPPPPSLSHESAAAQILENWPYSVTMCHIWLHFGDNKLRVWENTERKQDLTLTNTESRSVFMEVQCGRSLNVDDAPSASAPHPEGNTDSISPLAWQPPHLSLVERPKSPAHPSLWKPSLDLN